MLKTFFVALVGLHLSLLAAKAQDSAASGPASLGYPSAAAALDGLRKKPGVSISMQGGWTIAADRSANAIWSFTPPEHPAHPAVVRRTIIQKDAALHAQMNVLCKATKLSCDKLVADFNQLNNRMRDSIKRN